MKVLLRKELKELLEQPRELGVSIYMPTSDNGDNQEGPIRLRNLVRQAEKQLVEAGMRDSVAKHLLAQVLALSEDVFWKSQGDTLALLVSPSTFRYYRLPFKIPETVLTSERFHITPLVKLFSSDRMFYVLALSQNSIRLIQCSRDSLRNVTPESVPGSLAEHLRYDSGERQTQYHSGGLSSGPAGRGSAIQTGQEGGASRNKDSILSFFTAVDRGLHELLKGEHAPLVIAGVDYLHPLYRQANTYPHLLTGGIEGNPDDMTGRVLQSKGWALVQPYFEEDKTKALRMYRTRAGTGQTTDDLNQVVNEAVDGHVFKLFVAADVQRWGTYDRETRAITVHERQQRGDEDLIEYAAEHSLINGGTLFVMDSGEMPAASPLAALLRYAEVPATPG
ncbi:MAG: hypothetical protein Q7T05_00060 [Dehalococcoidia bacterium]|nr:hypothetical protein [Dehalococcoidia bacterium]